MVVPIFFKDNSRQTWQGSVQTCPLPFTDGRQTLLRVPLPRPTARANDKNNNEHNQRTAFTSSVQCARARLAGEANVPVEGGKCQLRRVASRTAARTSRVPRMLLGGAPRAERRVSRVARRQCVDLNAKNRQERGPEVACLMSGCSQLRAMSVSSSPRLSTAAPCARGRSERRGARRGRDRGLGRLLRLWLLLDVGLWRRGRSCDYHWSRSWPLAAVLNDLSMVQ